MVDFGMANAKLPFIPKAVASRFSLNSSWGLPIRKLISASLNCAWKSMAIKSQQKNGIIIFMSVVEHFQRIYRTSLTD